jgi:hypothetical protein
MLLARFFAVMSAMSFLFCSPGSSWPQSRLRGRPRLPFTDDGACPFEGCQYAPTIQGFPLFSSQVQFNVVSRPSGDATAKEILVLCPDWEI